MSQAPLPISQKISEMVDSLQKAILAYPDGPHLYQRARQLCILARGTTPPKWLRRPVDLPVIVAAPRAYLRELAADVTTWQQWKEKDKKYISALPPIFVIDALMARPAWTFHVLEGLAFTPTLRPDGSLLDTPGYDAETGLVLDLNGTSYPPLPAPLDLEQAKKSIEVLKEPFRDFPFAGDCHKSAALAAVLSLVAASAIQGKVPLFAVRSTIRGSGKGLLIDVITLIGTGRVASRWAQTLDLEEDRKRLLTIGLAGDPCIHIDNVTAPLGSSALDLALTAQTFADRILGQQARMEVPMHVIFFASGNNMQFAGDMARRVLPIDLAPTTEKPEERSDFTHPRLLEHVAKERSQLVIAALTVLTCYFKAGRPTQNIATLGSFEAWSDLVRSALVWAGEVDPCEGRHEIEAESDPDYEALNTLLIVWSSHFQKNKKTLREVKDYVDGQCKHHPVTGHFTIQPNMKDLYHALVNVDTRGQLNERSVGYALRKWKGRIINGRWFTATLDKKSKIQQWSVEGQPPAPTSQQGNQ